MKVHKLFGLSLLIKFATAFFTNEEIQVFDFLDKGQNCSTTSIIAPIKDLEPSRTLENFTVCTRFMFRFQNWMALLSIKDIHNLRFSNFILGTGVVGFNGGSHLYQWRGKLDLRPDNWISLCYSFVNNGLWVVMNGKLLHNDILNLPDIDLSSEYLTKNGLNIGIRDSDGKLTNRFTGMISDVNIWSHGLKIEEMIHFCTKLDEDKKIPEPDLINWNNVSIDVDNECIKSSTMPRKSLVLKEQKKVVLLIETKTDFENAKLNCQAFGGELFLPRNEKDIETLQLLVNNSTSGCRYWLGGTKDKNGKIFDLNGNIESFARWSKSEPNGRAIEQCIVTWISKSEEGQEQLKYYDFACEYEFCYPCYVPSKQSFNIRGSIPIEQYDTTYQVNLANVPWKIRGLSKSQLEWKTYKWFIGDKTWTNWTQIGLPPFGLNSWRVHENVTKLLFTQESTNNFACHKHGNLIPMSRRCDGLIDCPYDFSDEQNCNIFDIPSTYVKSKNPFDHITRLPQTITKVTFQIKNIFDIKEVNMEFKARIKVVMEWFDPRITFRNLRNNSKENIIPMELHDSIWKPLLFFANSNEGQRTRVDSEASVNVKKQGKQTLSPLSDIFQDYLFKGSENPFEIQRYYTVTLYCPFEMKSYPFDGQACPITIEVPFDFTNEINITIKGKPKLEREIILPQYEFYGLSNYILSEDKKTLTIFVYLKRNYWNHLITTFVPTICLVLIAELTLFIDMKYFEATMMVSLTAMLVMYTLHQSISETLPVTTYMKMIDIWLFVGLIIPFVVLVTLVVANGFIIKEPKMARIGALILQWARFAIPVITSILIFIFGCVSFSMA